DHVNGNWWLLHGVNYTEIGFWPASIFTGLKNQARTAEWGGVAYSPPVQDNLNLRWVQDLSHQGDIFGHLILYGGPGKEIKLFTVPVIQRGSKNQQGLNVIIV
uniref:Uncharacterized protein LOC104213549 n=1 Tax=Nicotiana sylvestris TaxID=4096 RepID=A0A1U7V4Q6_NICSY